MLKYKNENLAEIFRILTALVPMQSIF